MAGVSRETVRRVEILEKEAAPELKEAVRSGETSISAAFRQIRPPANGKSLVNGVVADDPPDVAAARADGKIPADAVVKVEDVGADPGGCRGGNARPGQERAASHGGGGLSVRGSAGG